MTTIIATKDAMIGDLQTTKGSTKTKTAPKIFKLNGEIIGMAGDLNSILAAREWFVQGKQGDFPKGESLFGVIINKEGIWEFFDNGMPVKYPGKFLAVGSGSELAMGAMEAGADIQKAMKVAMKYDAGTGFGTTYLELD